MTHKIRSNRKASDADIIRMNSVGLSLATIARLVGCHPTSITLRLKNLNIEPADTRRAFMEDVFTSLGSANREWLADQLGPHLSIKQYVTNLLVKEYQRATQPNQLKNVTPLP